MAAVQRERPSQVRPKPLRNGAAFRQQVPHPKPRQAPERHFKRTSPIHADRVGVLLLPVVPKRQQLRDELLPPGQPVRLRQRGQPLLPVQLPDDLVVADLLEVEESDLVPGPAGRALGVYGVELPVHFRSVVQGVEAQDVEAVLRDPPRLLDDAVRLFREALAQRLDNLGHVCRGKEEAPGSSRHASGHRSRYIHAQRAPQPVPALRRLLTRARADLFPAHTGQPPRVAFRLRAPSLDRALVHDVTGRFAARHGATPVAR